MQKQYVSRIVAVIASLSALALILTAVSCETPPKQEPAMSADEGASHAVHSRQLREVMADLAGGAKKTWPQEIAEEKAEQTREQRKQDFGRAAKLAKALKRAAADIPGACEGMEMTPAEQQTFMALVRQLEFQSAELASAAKSENQESMKIVLRRIKNTCYDCHDQFRCATGPIEYPF